MLKGKEVNFQKIWNSLLETNRLTIRHLQTRRKMTEKKLELAAKYNHKALIASYNKIWTELNEELQDIWGIPRDAEMYKFWKIPGCECPAQCNEERYGWGKGHIINSNCPIHGAGQRKWEKIQDELEDIK